MPVIPKSDNPIGSFGRGDDFSTPIKLPPHQLKIDEKAFLRLLAGSVSLMREEKKRIIQAVPRLTQEQIDELIRILGEEKEKFSELDISHKDQLRQLEAKAESEWSALELEMSAPQKAKDEKADAEKIRQQLQQSSTQPPPPPAAPPADPGKKAA